MTKYYEIDLVILVCSGWNRSSICIQKLIRNIAGIWSYFLWLKDLANMTKKRSVQYIYFIYFICRYKSTFNSDKASTNFPSFAPMCICHLNIESLIDCCFLDFQSLFSCHVQRQQYQSPKTLLRFQVNLVPCP